MNYISSIRHIYHKNVEITEPSVLGDNHPVWIVTDGKEKSVFRFSDKETAFRNYYTSKILRKHGIIVPDIQIYRIDNKYCEFYPFIDGKTLFERKQEGITPYKVQKVFTQLFDICHRMSEIPLSEMQHLQDLDKNTKFSLFRRKIHIPKTIGHSNLNDKNILLDKQDNVCGILGLDAISLKPATEHFARLLETAKENGYDIENINQNQHNELLRKIVMNIKSAKDM